MESAAAPTASKLQAGSSSQISVILRSALKDICRCTASHGGNGALLWSGCSGRVRWAILSLSVEKCTRAKQSRPCLSSQCSVTLLLLTLLKLWRTWPRRFLFKHSCAETMQFWSLILSPAWQPWLQVTYYLIKPQCWILNSDSPQFRFLPIYWTKLIVLAPFPKACRPFRCVSETMLAAWCVSFA